MGRGYRFQPILSAIPGLARTALIEFGDYRKSAFRVISRRAATRCPGGPLQIPDYKKALVGWGLIGKNGGAAFHAKSEAKATTPHFCREEIIHEFSPGSGRHAQGRIRSHL
jgi:hypothetical protein